MRHFPPPLVHKRAKLTNFICLSSTLIIFSPNHHTNMRHLLLTSTITMAPSSSSSPSLSPSKPYNKKQHSPSNPNPNPNPSSDPWWSALLCKHSPSATLDILILLLVVFSGAFLVLSYFADIFQSLSPALPPISFSGAVAVVLDLPITYIVGFVSFFLASVAAVEIRSRLRKCRRRGCKGLKKAVEFDLQVQSDECLKSESESVREIDELPWKGGSETNRDYECLRMELRKMAPPNGRAVLLFRAKCGCPVAKLEGWGAKRGRRHKK